MKFVAGPAGVEPTTPDLEGVLRNSVELQSGALDELLSSRISVEFTVNCGENRRR